MQDEFSQAATMIATVKLSYDASNASMLYELQAANASCSSSSILTVDNSSICKLPVTHRLAGNLSAAFGAMLLGNESSIDDAAWFGFMASSSVWPPSVQVQVLDFSFTQLELASANAAARPGEGAITGGASAVAALLAVLGALLFLLFWRRRRKTRSAAQKGEDEDDTSNAVPLELGGHGQGCAGKDGSTRH